MEINFKIAIYTGFLLATFFSVLPAILKRKNFKVLMGDFILSFIGITILVFMTTLLIDTQMSSPEFINTQMSSPERLKRKEAGHFIHLHSAIIPNDKRS